ncbi:VP3 [Erythrura gouldiae polyomavirus 1]|nr:VP3 [Erythrura gouldiae polyomavirus 1]AKT44370.1 VP3 [Erythrura gouldiae polyomavirus 1]
MAVAVWRPEVDFLFPGASELVDALYYINPLEWGPTIFQNIGRYIWDYVIQTGRRQLGEATRAIVQTTSSNLYDLAARAAERATWYITEGPIRSYRFLEDYYMELPILRPDARRGRALAIGSDAEEEELPEGLRKLHPKQTHEPTGATVAPSVAPGGANQRHCPDWMLPLILGLYGVVYPGWKAEVELLEKEESQHGSKTGPYRRSRSKPRSKTPYQRRHRSSRSKVRSR